MRADNKLFSVGQRSRLGMALYWSTGGDRHRTRVLHAVIWYPRGRRRLGYLYPSIMLWRTVS